MKRLVLLMTTAAALIGFCMTSAFAAEIAIVDMQKIFQSSGQVKQINDDLSKSFTSRRDNIVKMGKTFQEDVQKYQKNKTVMGAKELAVLKDKLTKEENDLRQAQTKYQQDLFAAQNEQMTKFMDKVKAAVKVVAMNKKLDVVVPKNSALYANDNLDITSDVVTNLK